ncbi:MAG: class I SAM-dependent methyltransferase [Clostridiales bacterium]|nr:class I SAM-dependent methyltransferase [Clostridiales bacterium]
MGGSAGCCLFVYEVIGVQRIFDQVERNIDRLVERGVDWSACATPEQIARARSGRLELLFGCDSAVPAEWLGDVRGKKVLCLAGAGGLQAPLLAGAGAEVTVLDLSQRMLDKDRAVAAREGLTIDIQHGNMCDLTRFEDESFDLVLNPPSLFYVPDVKPVFCEVYRVLKRGGCFIMCASNPIAYVCEYDATLGCYKAVNRMPYCSMDHDDLDEWVEFGHTMESYIGGQIACGFVISGYVERQMEDITELYFMTKGEKR